MHRTFFFQDHMLCEGHGLTFWRMRGWPLRDKGSDQSINYYIMCINLCLSPHPDFRKYSHNPSSNVVAQRKEIISYQSQGRRRRIPLDDSNSRKSGRKARKAALSIWLAHYQGSVGRRHLLAPSCSGSAACPNSLDIAEG